MRRSGREGLLLGPRVEAEVDGLEAFLFDVGVDLGGGNIGVA